MVLDDVYAFAKELSKRQVYRTDLGVPLPKFTDVGDLAVTLYDDISPFTFAATMPNTREETQAAAWLLRAIDACGCDIEDVIEHSQLSVALIVASVSSDYRLLAPRRKLDLLSRMGTACATAQFVTACEIVVQVEQLQKMPTQKLAAIGVTNLKLWVDARSDLLGAMHTLRDMPVIGPAINTIRDALPKVTKRLSPCRR